MFIREKGMEEGWKSARGEGSLGCGTVHLLSVLFHLDTLNFYRCCNDSTDFTSKGITNHRMPHGLFSSFYFHFAMAIGPTHTVTNLVQ